MTSSSQLVKADVFSASNNWDTAALNSRLVTENQSKQADSTTYAQGPCSASWLSHTSRSVKTEACLYPQRLLWNEECWKDVWGDQGRSQKQSTAAKLNSQSAETWVTTRHCKLLISTPAKSLEFAEQISLAETEFSSWWSLPRPRKGRNNKRNWWDLPGDRSQQLISTSSWKWTGHWTANHPRISQALGDWWVRVYCGVGSFACFHN